MGFSDAELLDYNPFEGERDVDIRCRTVKIVTTRKPQRCYGTDGKMHDITPGTRARFETALVDGAWGGYYTCVPCMEKWLASERVDRTRAAK